MPRLRIDQASCPAELTAGLRQIEADRPQAFTQTTRGKPVVFVHDLSPARPGFSITHKKHTATVRYSRPCDAFRALGHLLGQTDGPAADISQSCQFDVLGVKFDCSRNGVPRIQTLKTLFCQLALLGFNAFAPYTEDIYEIPGEPFFGYGRGRYTQADLKAIDDYAFALGIEVFANIRSLGHVGQILQWPVYAHLRDLPDVFLADHEPTYQFFEKMLLAVTGSLRSKRVFIGTDEAHGLGTGRYRRLKGYKPPFEIFSDHLRRICDLCKKYGLRPISSGDMYFRLGSKDNWYYDRDAVIPPEIIQKIPAEMQINYWDYYHTEPAFYEEWIDRHRNHLHKEPFLHGGVWTWNHFWAQLPFSFAATDALMTACRNKGIRENFCCLWNDDGSQCDPFSALPGVAHFAEHAYATSIDPAALRLQLRGAAGIDFDDFVRASDIDLRTDAAYMKQMPDNPSTWLLWDDPFLGLFQPQERNPDLAAHHRQLALDLDQAATKPGLAKRLKFPAQIARTLALKVDLRPRLVDALRAGDKGTLATLLRDQLAPLQKEVDKLWKLHRQWWLETYRPFGLEVLEGRYGALRARLQSLADRLKDYLAGTIDSIAELEATLLPIFPKDDIYGMIYHHRVATASAGH